MKNIKEIISILLLTIIILILTSCADLGNYKDTDDYYDYFPEVEVYKDFVKSEYDMSNFFDDDTFDDKKIEANIDEACYQGIVIKVEKEINLSDFIIYFGSQNGGKLDMDFYILEKNIEVEEISDETSTATISTSTITSTTKEKVKRFKNLPLESNAHRTYNATTLFDSVSFNTSTINVKSEHYLVIIINNNIDKDETNDVSFNFTNILIRNEPI